MKESFLPRPLFKELSNVKYIKSQNSTLDRCKRKNRAHFLYLKNNHTLFSKFLKDRGVWKDKRTHPTEQCHRVRKLKICYRNGRSKAVGTADLLSRSFLPPQKYHFNIIIFQRRNARIFHERSPRQSHVRQAHRVPT